VGIELTKDFDRRRDDPGPSRLVTGADAGAVVAMKILVEQQMVAPVRVSLVSG